MVKENLKRKKKHDRDKYYHLAKEQGYRSRAAFKLIQINRKYDFLSRAKVCLDLCAAPGGWCQVAAKHMPSESIILGVDLLPIRPIPKVKTLIQDITTPECRAAIKREMKMHPHVDVVLCDGAPNVGAAYDKDAFVQNEIALAALRTATHHLGPGGTFLTKVYRSQDYNALMWVFNQLFGTVQAIKPSSSRQQSAEIFVLCLKYRAPHSIDPKLLDPAYVFAEMEDGNQGKALNIFSTQYDKQKRHRGGYEGDVGVLLHKKATVADFVENEDPVQFLSDYNQLVFDAASAPYAEQKHTTEEVKNCVADLKVLGKGDFKSLLKWRLKMRAYRDSLLEASSGDKPTTTTHTHTQAQDEPKALTPEEEETQIQAEIRQLQEAKAAKGKRERKKERERLAKLRLRQAYGMHHDAFDLPEHEAIFSLKAIGDEGELERVRRGDFVEVGEGEDPEIDDGGGGGERVGDESEGEGEEEEERKRRREEEELEEAYQTYLSNKSDEKLRGTKAGKRKKAALVTMAGEKAAEDAAMYDGDVGGYVKLLSGKRGGDEDEDTDSDTESEEEEEEEEEEESEEEMEVSDGEGEQKKGKKDKKEKKKHPLLVDPKAFEGVEKSGAKVARWFSNPVFKSLGAAGLGEEEEEEEESEREVNMHDEESSSEGGEGEEEEDEEEEAEAVATDMKKRKQAEKASLVEEILASLPKTDKQLRHEKRMKARERNEKRQAKRQKQADPDGLVAEEEQELELVGVDDDESQNVPMTPEEKELAKKKRALIKAGMGALGVGRGEEEDGGAGGGFEVVPVGASSKMPPVMDDRQYDSENEEWDDEERARTLAIATMMLRRSKAKELVDASYNRFAWNDASDLPEWFADDEARHYRPQIPIPKPLMDEMKERFKTLASKPIAKVAEARARKKHRAMQKLKQAKNKASAIIANPDMTERDKMKAIQKAVKGKGELKCRPDKVYAVVRRGGSSQAKNKKKDGESSTGRSRVKLVDKRMKKDTRSMKKAAARKGGKGKGSGGKKGGKRKR